MEMKEKKGSPGYASQRGVELILRRPTGRTAKPIEIVGAVLGLDKDPLAQCKVIKLE
jgi:hypothetical protein